MGVAVVRSEGVDICDGCGTVVDGLCLLLRAQESPSDIMCCKGCARGVVADIQKMLEE
jgi:hypothetical protein